MERVESRHERRVSGENLALLARRPRGTQAEVVRFDTPGRPLYLRSVQQFLEVLTKADNIPIVGMLFLVLFFTWIGFKQALRNDRLIEQGRQDEILEEMQR